MSGSIQFVRNHNDLSTDSGYQFEFFCDRCGSGFRTHFKGMKGGLLGDALQSAGGLLGGVLGRAADFGDQVRSVVWERQHDGAFGEAVEEIRPEFIQCPRCAQWVCRKGCWNTKKGLCKECAPDLGVEMAAAQASKSVEEVWAHAAMAEEDKKLAKENWREGVRASCPKCEAPLQVNAKFCPECGEKLAAPHCTECGAKLTPGAKFCAECGAKSGE